MNNRGIFVKLNCKNISEVNSLIYDDSNNDQNKYAICAGKYNRGGWTIIFRAKTVDEAQELIDKNSRLN